MDISELIKNAFPFLEKRLINEIIDVSILHELRTDENILSEGDYIKSDVRLRSECWRM